jgi:hypothetical protein
MTTAHRYLLFLFALAFVILLCFSVVQGATPILIQNAAIISEPYATGIQSHDTEGRHSEAVSDASYDPSTGVVTALAGCYPSGSRSSSAWAEAYIGDAFEIVHSSDYKITFSFDYKGSIKITNPFIAQGIDATAEVSLNVFLIDTNDGSTIYQEAEKIFPLDQYQEDVNFELIGSRNIVLTIHLQDTHIYDWKAGLRIVASANGGAENDAVSVDVDFFEDAVGYRAKITQVAVEDLNPDNTAPSTASSFTGTLGDNGWYTSNVLVTLNATDLPLNGYGIEYINRRINDGSWSHYTAPFTINSDGTTIVDFYSVDRANNQENPPKTVSLKIDTSPPSGSVTINNNDEFTVSAAVSLLAQASDGQGSGLSEMRFRNEGSGWDSWMSYSSTAVSWTLNSGDGTKRVYVQFKDKAGNVSPEFNDEIKLDTSPPSGSVTINNNALYATSTSVTLQLFFPDSIDVNRARYSNDGVWDTEQWETASEIKNWTLSPEDETKTVYAQFKDQSGLESLVVSDTIILDTTPPTGALKINGDATETTSTSVTLTPTANDANGVAQMRFSNDNIDWSNWESFGQKQWILTDGIGEKTVYVQFKDNAGLISSPFSDTITLVRPQSSPSPSPQPTPTPPASQTGNIIIHITDSNNTPIAGAKITTLSQPSGQPALTGTTNPTGSLTFKNIVAGSYIFYASKNNIAGNSEVTTVKGQQTTSVTIVIQEDITAPTITITLNPASPGNSQLWVFTVIANDNNDGAGLSKVTLYVDEIAVETWTTPGTHTYTASFPPRSTHRYYAEALDNSNNEARNPPSENWEFSVPAQSATDSTELWKIFGIVIIIANGTALIFIFTRSKKSKKSEIIDLTP